MIFLAWSICMIFVIRIIVDSLDRQEQDSSELDH